MASPLFGVCFIGHSYPITDASFARTDDTHWVLDVGATVNPNVAALKEVALFLLQPGALPPDVALGLYVSVGGAAWSYRGYVAASHPSEVLPLSWPTDVTGTAVVGISVEPIGAKDVFLLVYQPSKFLAEVGAKEGSKLGAKEDFAKRVAMDLFRFMESFGQGPGGDTIVVPTNILERWYTRLSERLRRDPDFLTRAGAAV